MNTGIDEKKFFHVLDELRDIIHMISGMEKEDMEEDKKLISYGVDSILLLTLSRQIDSKYHVQISLDVFFTTLNTLRLIAEYIAENGEVQLAEEQVEDVVEEIDELESIDLEQETLEVPQGITTNERISVDSVAKMFESQYQIIKNQNEILRAIISGNKQEKNIGKSQKQETASVKKVGNKSEDYYKPYHKQDFNRQDQINPLQLKYIKNIQKRVNNLTRMSKEKTQADRSVYASNRNSAGFMPLYKEMIYQIIAEKGQGSKIVDIDGNEMIDLTMGFGVLLFGHGPEFVKEALRNEINNGLPLGPMGRLSGQVARQISELTGVERVFFTNSGTEADMFAVRIARAVTKKNKIVCFKGAFHGTYDGLLGLPTYMEDPDKATVSLVPGITDNAVKDLILLDYDSEESLRYIEKYSDVIAAVITEPVQSRRPDIQPKEFLQKLRKVTEENNVALIFDEIITGFRICSGGAQEYFDVQADIVTYGKVIGGGMPIGVLSGKKKYLDSIDGGMWKFGDDSVPAYEDKRTFVAGTFCHHPMAMAACNATLNYIKANKDHLYDELNQKTTEFVNELNTFFDNEKVDIHINQFGSLFRFTVKLEKEIFYYGLLEKGIYIWEGRNCFISTEHTKEDLATIIDVVKTTVYEMKEAGFFE